jgi:hypothetical protein
MSEYGTFAVDRGVFGHPLADRTRLPRRRYACRRLEPHHRLNDSREPLGQVVTGPAVEPHPFAILAGDAAEAVMLDLVQPAVTGGRALGRCGKARLDEPRRQGTQRNDMGGQIVYPAGASSLVP